MTPSRQRKSPLKIIIAGKDQHVVPHNDGWAVKGSGNQKVTIITGTQKEAIETARRIARNKKAEVFIHGRNGQIREKNNYTKKE